jgi:hypothetical protein
VCWPLCAYVCASMRVLVSPCRFAPCVPACTEPPLTDTSSIHGQEALLEIAIEGDPQHWGAILRLAALAFRAGDFQRHVVVASLPSSVTRWLTVVQPPSHLSPWLVTHRAKGLYARAAEVSGGAKDAVMGQGLADFRLGRVEEVGGIRTHTRSNSSHPHSVNATVACAATAQPPW